MRASFAIVLAVTIAGCKAGDQDIGVSGSAPVLPSATRIHLDSGNAAFRARDLASAERHYQQSLRSSPDLATPWFGLAMVARAQGDTAALRIAQYQAERLSPGVNTSHPVGGDLPPDHPRVAPDLAKGKAAETAPR